MNSLLTLLIRHGLASLGAFLAAHGISGNTTAGIVTGILLLLISTAWSWISKGLKLEETKGDAGIRDSEVVRILVGSLASQLITWLSTYYAIDANNPELLAVAIANTGLSKLGAHQKLAFLGAKDALKVLTFVILHSSFVIGFSSCTTQQRTLALSLADLGLQAAVARGKVSAGDAILVRESVAVVTSGETTQSKVVKLAEIGLQAAADKQLIAPGDRILVGDAVALIHKAAIETTAAKQPVNITPGGQASAPAAVGKAGALPSSDTINPRGSNAEAASDSQSRPGGSLTIYPYGAAVTEITQSGPHPARAVKVMESAAPLYARGRLAGQPQGQVTIPLYGSAVVAALRGR